MALWDTGDTNGIRGLATHLGLRFVDTPTDRTYQIEIGELPRVGILGDVENEATSNLMYGRYRGCNIQLFDVDLATFEHDPASPKRSVVLLTFAAGFPHLSVTPHTPMSKMKASRRRHWLDFAPDEFQELFQVVADDEETARALLSDSALVTLAQGRNDVMLELSGGSLLAHGRQIDENDQEAWMSLVDYAIDFHGLIPERAWVEFGTFRLP